MSVEITQSEEFLVYSPPVNEATKKWGVYAIPRMWREPDGTLIVRFNGEMDSGDADHNQMAENLYFESKDNGRTWKEIPDGNEKFDVKILNGHDSPYIKVDDGFIAFREKSGLSYIENTQAQKEFVMPNEDEIVKAYRYGDIPDDARGFEMLKIADGKTEIVPVDFDFPEREVLVISKGYNGSEYCDIKERLKPMVWKNPYFASVVTLPDGTLGAISCGQNPDVDDHYSGAAYFIVSDDGGVTWKKRADAAIGTEYEFGYTGDGHENSLAVTENGTLVLAMRMDMSINPDKGPAVCDTMVTISEDNGYTWCKPFSISDSSVTPHVVALENGITVIVYGRPGVHFKYSEDDGKTWSESVSVIGNTLEECRSMGIKDSDSKYFDTISYSNTFVEKTGKNSFLVLYNNLKYDDGDGQNHKAAFVKEITFEKE